jgi:hypothetical protein
MNKLNGVCITSPVSNVILAQHTLGGKNNE